MKYLLLLLLCSAALAGYAQAGLFTVVNRADYAFTGTIDVVKANRGGFMQVSFGEVQSLDSRKMVTTIFAIRPPLYDSTIVATNKTLIGVVDVDSTGDHWTLTNLFPATPENVKLAKSALALPVGWGWKDDKPLSPWLGRVDAVDPIMDIAGLAMTVETIMPEVVLPKENPLGDGLFRLNIVNNSEGTVSVPELLTDGKEIRWDASLLTLFQGEVHILPQRTAHAGLKEVKLQPGEAVSGLINTLTLNTVDWPKGDKPVPVNYKFAIGRLTAPASFMYFPKRHDAMHSPAMMKQNTTVTPKAGTTTMVSLDFAASIIDVTCPRGIGGMMVSVPDGKWPALLTLRLHLKGMENFTVKSATTTVTAEVNSGTHVVRQNITMANQLDITDESSLKVHAGDDFFDVTLPTNILRDTKELTVSWIDFYR